MNLIKLKDMIMPEDQPMAEYFNKHLKGKYAYWVQMRYIVSFDHMRHEGYVACEEDITKLLQREDGSYPKPYGAPTFDVYDMNIMKYVDSVETDRINSTIEFRMKNSYSPDNDITIDELKLFRTWLAQELLKMDQTELGEQKKAYFSYEQTHVLEYYANNMYNDTIKILSTFGVSTPHISSLTSSTCGCMHGANLSSLYNTELNVCDPINVYRKNIYDKMVEMFSVVEFWSQWSSEFINEIQKYIDNIIKCNFILTQSEWQSEFVDCGCQNTSEQEKAIEILKRFSVSLGYIKNDQIIGHKNYINDALYDWASLLYEKMYW